MTDALRRVQEALADRYHIERELGRGGMATVYLADDFRHHRRVAVKVLHPALAEALGPERFLREIEISAGLNHPHILPLLDSGRAHGVLFYTMPYVEGESLRERMIREKQLPLEDAVRIARQVADALDYAHRHDVVHRDIKPENILLEEGHAVVADFGIARAVNVAAGQKLTATGVALGTADYMSPEQAGGSPELDGRSDLYSLGCVLYEMLAGQPPFAGPTVESLVRQHLTTPPPRVTEVRPTVPRWVAVALDRALAKAPADRYTSAAQFAQAMTPPTSGETPSVGIMPASRRTFPAGRKPTIGLAAGAVVVVALLGVALLLPRRGTPMLDPNRVLVVAFAGQGGSEEQALGRMAQDYVIQVLTDAGFAKVVDPLTTLAVSRNVAAARATGDAGSIFALAREAGAGTVVSGNYYTEGDSLHIQTRISNARDGSLMGTVGPIVGSTDARRELVGRLGREVVAALATLLNRELGAFEPTAPPATFEAEEAYTEGFEAYLDNAYDAAARDFERAVAADPAFTRARLWAAQAMTVQGLSYPSAPTYAKAESLLAPLVEAREQLGRYDRCRLDFIMAMRQAATSRSYDGARCMAQAAPGSDDARREVALFAYRLQRPREAIRLLRELDPDHGLMKLWWGYWSYLSDAYYSLGDYEGQLAIAQEGRRRYPENQVFPYEEARALAALGRLDDVATRLKAMRSQQSAGGMGGYLFFLIGQELRARGYRDAAREAFDQAIASYQSQPQDPDAARAMVADALYEAERWNDALPLMQELAGRHRDKPEYLVALALLGARQGDRAPALRIRERLGSVRDSLVPSPGAACYERARLAAVLGEREEAVALLRQWIDEGGGWDHWPSLLLSVDFESLRDYPPFQELMTPKG
jgi:tetratricopeptide (TPR) repeat protein/tRNA A-37 threonylcarbamoyl transferase component Bud32